MPKATKYLLVLLLLVLLVASACSANVQIDAGQIALLALLLIVLLIDRVRSFKVGGNEVVLSDAEIQSVQEAKSELADAPEELEDSPYNQLRIVYDMDPRLAFAKLRMMIEETLHRRAGIPRNRPKPLTLLIADLEESSAVKSSLATVVRYANSLIHGAEFEPEQASKLFDLAISLTIHLDVSEYMRHKVVDYEQISHEDQEKISGSALMVRTLIPYAENPQIRTYQMTPNELHSFAANLVDVAEHIIEVTAQLPSCEEPCRPTP